MGRLSKDSKSVMDCSRIRIYGTMWCGDCHRAQHFFDLRGIQYDWIDIEGDEEAREYVRQVNDSYERVPVVVFTDGSILIEPTNLELARKVAE